MQFTSIESKRRLFEQIDAIPELAGAGVGYLDGRSCSVLRRSQHSSGLDTYIVFEESIYDAAEDPVPPRPQASKDMKSSKLRRELVASGINCTGAVLAGAAATAGAAAAPVTGGASGVITLVAGAAAIASAAQCGISVGRVMVELLEPGGTEEYFDNEEWYKWTSNILDAVNLLGIVAGAPGAYTSISKILKMRQVTGKGLAEIIAGLSRQERRLLARELVTASEKISNKQWKRLVRLGKLPKIYSQSALTKTILEQLTGRVADVLSLYSSTDSGNIALIIHVVQE